MLQAKQSVVMDVLWANGRGTLRNLALVVAGSLALVLSAKAQIPFYPVPMTLQPLVVLVLGMILGSRLGALAVLCYLGQGMLGLPVFAGTPEKGLGLAYMAGPTGGYLVGFVAAAYVTGWFAERGFDRSRLGTAVALGAGLGVIYLCGLAWLGGFVGYSSTLLQLGLMPFVLGDLVKIALAMVSMPLLWSLLSRR